MKLAFKLSQKWGFSMSSGESIWCETSAPQDGARISLISNSSASLLRGEDCGRRRDERKREGRRTQSRSDADSVSDADLFAPWYLPRRSRHLHSPYFDTRSIV